MGRLLSRALATSQWQHAQAVVQPLHEYWDRGGLVEEARAWTDRIRIALDNPDGKPPSLDDTGGALWLFIIGAHAKRLIDASQLDAAEQAYTEIYNMLLAGLTDQLSLAHLEQRWQHLTGEPLPASVRAFIEAQEPIEEDS